MGPGRGPGARGALPRNGGYKTASKSVTRPPRSFVPKKESAPARERSAQQAIILINFYLKLDIEVIMSDHTADLILGVIGVVSALEDLLEDTREGHGINDGCDLYELGNTFRLLNRDHPNTFPPGSTKEL